MKTPFTSENTSCPRAFTQNPYLGINIQNYQSTTTTTMTSTTTTTAMPTTSELAGYHELVKMYAGSALDDVSQNSLEQDHLRMNVASDQNSHLRSTDLFKLLDH